MMMRSRMLTIEALAAALLLCRGASAQQAAHRRQEEPRRQRRGRSHPRFTPIGPSRSGLAAPKAAEVTLNGSWEGARNIAMSKGENGVWSVTVGPLSPQLWGYWFLVDGVKALDPGNGETQRDGSRIDNLLMISGPESDSGPSRTCRTGPSTSSGILRRR